MDSLHRKSIYHFIFINKNNITFFQTFIREEDKRKIYRITVLGREVLNIEMKRIERLYVNMKEMKQ